jgi:transketolase
VLSRQKLPVLDRAKYAPAGGLARGAYVLSEPMATPRAIVIASGSEVQVALAAQELLAQDGLPVRVVSMPCWELFSAQDQAYHEQVLPRSIRARVAVEAGATFGWCRWIGDGGIAIGVDRYGASAPGEVNMERYGFSADNVARAVRRALG